MRALAAVAFALGACTGTTGTITLDLATAPDSHLLDAVQRLRVTITDPRQVVEATRTASGFDLALEVDATATNGALSVEGFDAAGALIACGQSPRFPVAAINAHVVVYVAAPRSIAVSPAKVSAARGGVAAAPISLGAVLAGGIETTGAPSTATAVYNAFDHSLVEGIPLPAPRVGPAMATDASGGVYMFGGTGPGGQPAGTLWRFDTTVPPNGAFAMITDQPGYARTGELIVPVGAGTYLITGTPALELSAGMLTARSDVTGGLPAAGATAVPGDGMPTAIFAGDAVVRFRGNAFAALSGDHPVAGAAAVTLPDGRIAVIGGTASRDVLVVDAAAGSVAVIPGVLSTARIHPAVAATSRHVVVTGGLTPAGDPIAAADVLDARTLAPVVTLPLVTGSGGFAIALPNDQVLIGGGSPALPMYELFTPEPPP